MRLALLAALLIAAAAPAPADPAVEAVTLRYRVAPGQVFAHRIAVQMRLNVSGPPEMKVPEALRQGMDGTVTGRLTTIVTGAAEEGGHKVLQGANLAADMMGRTRRSSVGPLSFILTPTGALRAPDAANEEDTLAKQLRGHIAGVLFPLPEKPIRPGETWSHDVSALMPDGSPFRVAAQARFAGRTVVNGEPCARIDLRGTVPRTSIPMPGGSLAMSVTVWDVSHFSLRTGVPIRQEGWVRLKTDIAGTDGKSGSIAADVHLRVDQVGPTTEELAAARRLSGRAPVLAVQPGRRETPASSGEVASAPGPLPAGEAPPADVPQARRASAVSSITLRAPAPGDEVRGGFLVHAEVPAESPAVFGVFLVDGERVAAVNRQPIYYRFPPGSIPPGTHTIGVEVYGEHVAPLGAASVRVRVVE